MSLADLDVAGKRVFLRCDLNVPLKEGKITDDGRIRASLPTINELLAQGASIVIAAHLGRPKGEAKPELSLAPVAVRLSELLGKPVQFAGAITGALFPRTLPACNAPKEWVSDLQFAPYLRQTSLFPRAIEEIADILLLPYQSVEIRD